MSMRISTRTIVMWTLAIAVPTTAPATAAPVLRAANVHIIMTSPITCEVTMALTVEDATEIDHRIESAAADLLDMQGAQHVGEPRTIGRTQSLVVRPWQPSYAFRYRSTQSEDRAYRCPIWLPAVPTDGLSRTVRVEVDLPSSVLPSGSMPAMTWTGTHGTTILGHVPAFVRLPYAAQGETPRWDIAQVMDAAAIAAFAGASALWIWRRRR